MMQAICHACAAPSRQPINSKHHPLNMPSPYTANAKESFDVTCHHQDFAHFCGPACLLMLINHLKNSGTAVTSEVELHKSLQVAPGAGDYGMMAAPRPMVHVLNAAVPPVGGRPSYKIIWGKTAERMAERVVNSILKRRGPVLIPVHSRNHWILIYRAETDSKGDLKNVGMRNPVTVGAPPYDPTGPEFDHAPGLLDPCIHELPHIQDQSLDTDGLLIELNPTQWAFEVYRNCALVPDAVPDLDPEGDAEEEEEKKEEGSSPGLPVGRRAGKSKGMQNPAVKGKLKPAARAKK